MSDVRASGIQLLPVELLPKEIKLQARYNVRPFSTNHTDDERQRIEALAYGIEEMGQLDNLIVTPDHTLIAGHRRRQAVMLINERRSARGASLLRLRCTIDTSGGDLRQKAIASNLHRRESSPMDLAYLIAQIREEKGWDAQHGQGTLRIAEYLGVNEGTVRAHERLLCAEKQLQDQIHLGIITPQSAHVLMQGCRTPAERARTLKRAAEIQEEDALDKALTQFQDGKKSAFEAERAIRRPQRDRIERPAIVAAIRETHTAIRITGSKRISLSRPELIASVSQFDLPSYPEPLREFARYWSRVYAQGLGDPEELKSKFLSMAASPPTRDPQLERIPEVLTN